MNAQESKRSAQPMVKPDNPSAQEPLPGKSRIAIVGGGMVGAVQALLLAQNVPSAEITLYDKSHNSPTKRASFDGRSTALAPTTQQCFERLNLWPAIEPYATPIHRVNASDKGHAGMALLDQRDNDGNPLGYVVMNSGLGQVVLDAIKASPAITEVIAGVEKITPKQQGADLQLAVGEDKQRAVGEDKQKAAPIAFDLVIVADGAHSALRQQLGITVDRTDYDQCALVANVRHEIPHECTAYERFRAAGPIALLPLGGSPEYSSDKSKSAPSQMQGHKNHSQTNQGQKNHSQKKQGSCESTVVWACTRPVAESLMAQTEAERLRALQHDFGYRLGHFHAMSEPACYPLSLIVAREQVRSGIVLLGNAAHFLHPVAGQGFNLSVRDMLRLTALLKQAVAKGEPVGDLAVLQQYEQQQQADQRNTIQLSHGFNRVFGADRLPAQLLRTLGMLAVETQPLIRAAFIDVLSGKAQPQAAL